MAEKKEKKIVKAETTVTADGKKVQQAKPVGNSKALRFGAIALWVVALVFEILAILVVVGKINLKFMPTLWQLICLLALDFILVIIGSQLWKKANHISPMSEKNKFLFWLWNNMGVIAAIICFAPIIIIMLTNKDLDKKTKVIATVVAVIMVLIAGLASYDFNPVSKEDQQAAINELGDQMVYWAPFGKVYHTHTDCGALNQTDTLTEGTVEQAIAANRTRICSFCAHKDAITDLPTD
ncbi:MAG: hypothetical protein IKI62_00910 [Clostridia bacterium]|nr:hypothetical protein [Clostridia bacterium]